MLPFLFLSQTLGKTELTDEQYNVVRNVGAKAFLVSQSQGSYHSLGSEKQNDVAANCRAIMGIRIDALLGDHTAPFLT